MVARGNDLVEGGHQCLSLPGARSAARAASMLLAAARKRTVSEAAFREAHPLMSPRGLGLDDHTCKPSCWAIRPAYLEHQAYLGSLDLMEVVW